LLEILLEPLCPIVIATLQSMTTENMPSGEHFADFVASLPPSYLQLFDAEAAMEHAAIVARRTGGIHLELWRALPGGLCVMCLVADDRAGLLAAVSSALTEAGLLIEGAQIFTRKRSPLNEAIDFFWVRPDTSASVA